MTEHILLSFQGKFNFSVRSLLPAIIGVMDDFIKIEDQID